MRIFNFILMCTVLALILLSCSGKLSYAGSAQKPSKKQAEPIMAIPIAPLLEWARELGMLGSKKIEGVAKGYAASEGLRNAMDDKQALAFLEQSLGSKDSEVREIALAVLRSRSRFEGAQAYLQLQPVNKDGVIHDAVALAYPANEPLMFLQVANAFKDRKGIIGSLTDAYRLKTPEEGDAFVAYRLKGNGLLEFIPPREYFSMPMIERDIIEKEAPVLSTDDPKKSRRPSNVWESLPPILQGELD